MSDVAGRGILPIVLGGKVYSFVFVYIVQPLFSDCTVKNSVQRDQKEQRRKANRYKSWDQCVFRVAVRDEYRPGERPQRKEYRTQEQNLIHKITQDI